MTIATLLDYIELFDSERNTGSGETDEARGITAINIVQDWFEAIVAGESEIFQRYLTVTTTADTEVTSWPSGLLRLDALWYVDTTQTPNLPQWALEPMYETGGHRPSLSWPDTIVLTNSTGKPRRYYATGPHSAGRIFWEPVPDAAYTIRYYGLIAGTDYTVRGDTFSYPDPCAPAFAAEATKILRMGRDDPIADLQKAAGMQLAAALENCRRWWNDDIGARHYSEAHEV